MPPFLMTIWAVKALEPSLRVRSMIVPIFVVPISLRLIGPENVVRHEKSTTLSYHGGKIGQNEPEMVRHQQWIKDDK